MHLNFNHALALTVCLAALGTSSGDCPWPRAEPESSALNAACLCALNAQNEFSVQCSGVNFPLLMGTLHARAADAHFDLLYVNNSNVEVLGDRSFFGLRIRNLQLSFCRIANISHRAFEGLENTLENLNLQDNHLQEIPTLTFMPLQTLNMLDLSGNRFTNIPNQAFVGALITTLKLSGNAISMSPDAFAGLEGTLKNLNLKGCQLRTVPGAIGKLKSLAFLDLAQNEIRELDASTLDPLDSLTALNLERNLLQDLTKDVFRGVEDSLSSLSLLNNLLTEFPTLAINSLPQLRVLDIGFNMITMIPENAFQNINSLTLLAVDGNPLPTVPENAFRHLNGTLRGLSLGGHYFNCDCHVSWVIRWIQEFDLQVTSRDRDPKFCGQPTSLRATSFYQLSPSDLKCHEGARVPELISGPPEAVEEVPERKELVGEKTELMGRVEPVESMEPSESEEPTKQDRKEETVPVPRPEVTRKPEVKEEPVPTTPKRNPPTTMKSVSTYKPSKRPTRPPPPSPPTRAPPRGEAEPQEPPTPTKDQLEELVQKKQLVGGRVGPQRRGEVQEGGAEGRPYHPNRGQMGTGIRRNPLIRRPHDRPKSPDEFYSSSSREDSKLYGEEVIVQDAYWDTNAINIQWDSEISNILGFRVVYRLFGDKYFKMGQPLAPSAREFKIKNVPANEYFVACVVSLEEMDIQLESVPFGQCREIRTGDSNGKLSTHMDKIIIAASASICGTVIIAVIIFICCYRGKGKSHNEKQGMPSVLNPSSPPLASLGTLGGNTKADWDTISMYSQRSIPRARMYHQGEKEDTRSHISHMSTKSRARSLADGQSQRSFSGMSGVHLPPAHFASPLSLSRPDLHLSRQSLAHSQFGSSQFGSGYPHFANPAMISRATSQRSERRRSTRSKSRERTSSRLSHAGSSHSLTGYDTDGWTDHDMDIYMARNATRGGLVQL